MSTAAMARNRVRENDPRRLLLARAAVLVERTGRSLSRMLARAWKWWRGRAQARGLAGGGAMSAAIGRALAGKGSRSRMLAVEERLALGPKQHLYVIRCGNRRLLVASAGEAALQWMTLPEEGESGETNECDNTESPAAKSVKKRAAKSPAGKSKRASGLSIGAGMEKAR